MGKEQKAQKSWALPAIGKPTIECLGILRSLSTPSELIMTTTDKCCVVVQACLTGIVGKECKVGNRIWATSDSPLMIWSVSSVLLFWRCLLPGLTAPSFCWQVAQTSGSFEEGSRAASPAAMLRNDSQNISKAAARQLREKSLKARSGILGLLKELACVLPDQIPTSLSQLIPGIQQALQVSMHLTHTIHPGPLRRVKGGGGRWGERGDGGGGGEEMGS